MQNVSIARRYARALIDVAGANSDRVLEQLERFNALLQQSGELSDVVTNPAYSRSQRSSVVGSVMEAAKIDDPGLANLLRLLVDRHRFGYLPDIARLYRDLADAKAGRVRGRVTSAVPLAKEALTRIEQSLEKVTQRDVVLEAKVDPSVLGGVSAQVGSIVYDGTLKSQLETLRRSLG
jgi:F-type H+-transporting ATPase subunit delta